jgi:hypothetical protein
MIRTWPQPPQPRGALVQQVQHCGAPSRSRDTVAVAQTRHGWLLLSRQRRHRGSLFVLLTGASSPHSMQTWCGPVAQSVQVALPEA